MDTDFYKSYVEDLRDTLQHGQRRGAFTKAENFLGSDGSRSKLIGKLKLRKQDDERLFESLQPLSSISGQKVNYHLRPGEHPDFKGVKSENSFENHYICSVFIDVKKSTNLFKKYNPITVANIINTIQKAAVHTSWYFNGYIQRYHGDGLFAYFGGRNISMTDAVNQALSANSFISYFMQHDLKNLFNEQGIENIYTRIGIDMGEAEDVLWYMAGMGECSEITTCSLHTSLACKMQGVASSNGIIVGENIKTYANLHSDLFQYVKDSNGKIDYYAFEIPDDNFYYKQWDFKWDTFLKNLPNIKQGDNGNLFINTSPTPIAAPNLGYLANEASKIVPWFK